MRVIALRTLRQFWETHPRGHEAEGALRAWYAEAARADSGTPADVKAQYRSASVLTSGRVVFNVADNKSRLVVHVNFAHHVVYVRFVGTPAEYDAVDADTVRAPYATQKRMPNAEPSPAVAVRPIRAEADYDSALADIASLMDAAADSPEGDRLDVLVTLVQAYEARHYPVLPPDPVDAIRFRMEQEGLRPRDLEPYIGGRGRVSEVLGRKRALTLPMIRRLAAGLAIPAGVLVGEPVTETSRRR